MEQRKLGSQGLAVSELGLGCVGMSEFYGAPSEKEVIATIHRALDLGVTLLDTADVYGTFTNERLIGRAIRGSTRPGPDCDEVWPPAQRGWSLYRHQRDA